MAEAPTFACPHCGAIAHVAGMSTAQFVTCGQCHVEFEVPAVEAEVSTDEALNGLRIRQVTAARRAANRIRSYYVIAGAASAATGMQLGWMAFARMRLTGVTPAAGAYLLFAGVGAFGAVYFGRRVVAMGRDASRHEADVPLHPPDVSTLGDGTDRWKRLDDVR